MSTARRWCWTGPLLALAALAVAPWPAGAAAANPSGDPGTPSSDQLEITSVSPWVAPDGTFEVSFSVPRDWPLDASVDATIGQRLRADSGEDLRPATDRLLDDRIPTRNLQAPVSSDLASVIDGSGTAVVRIPIRSTSGDNTRQLIPNPGIHPVGIEVSDPAGELLGRSTVFLNRLPVLPRTGRDDRPARTSVQLLAGLDSGPALGAGGETTLSTEERLAMAPWQELIRGSTDLPLTVALRPNTLLALQGSADSADRSFVTDLAGAKALTLAPQSYVRVDTAGLRDTGSGELNRQVRLGASILEDLTTTAPTGPWILDDTVDPRSAETLRGLGVHHLLVSEDRIVVNRSADRTGGDSRDGDSPTESTDLASHRTLALDGVAEMSVSTYDAPASRLLVAPEFPAALRAHRATTALMASWFDAVADGPQAFPGVSAALLISPSVDRAVLDALVDSMSTEGPLEIAPPPEPTHDEEGSPITARLSEREPEDLEQIVDRMQQVTAEIDGYRSMTGPDDPETAQWHLLNDQSPSISGGAATRAATWNGITGSISQRLSLIETPRRRTVVLTSRTGSIPVRIRNGLEGEVRLRMTARSPRLDFPDGPTTEVLLVPGENRIDLPVEVQAPGSSLLRIELTSPDSTLELTEVTVTVRSSSISGVGAVLSVLSVLVLGLWWIRTYRVRRRNDASSPTQGASAPEGTNEASPGSSVVDQESATKDDGGR